MKNTIPLFLQDKFALSRAVSSKFPEEIKIFIHDFAKFYKWNISNNLQQSFLAMSKGISTLPECQYNSCTNNVKIGRNSVLSLGYSHNHSQKISNLEKYGVESIAQLSETKVKREITCLRRYGETTNLKSKDTKEKIRKTCLEKYGFDSIFKVPKIRRKAEDTMVLKYGVKNYSMTKEFKTSMKKILLEKYGVETLMAAKEIRNKIKNTLKSKYNVTNISQIPGHNIKFKNSSLEHFGTEHPMINKTVKNKAMRTCFNKYGVSHPLQVPEFFEKAQKAIFKRKEYKWKTGEISLVQGYEPIVLKELEEQGYKFEDVFTSPKDMPKIMYQLNEKEHRYFPDIFIPKDNIIIEVKSDYTVKCDLEKNEAKFEATKALGFDFRLEVR